ncbi:uncharacterized protein LOC144864011 isoform X2 [Branchiostoma floridae x Branchiostoma japonicum]
MADADFLDLDDLDLLDDHQNVTENAEEYDFENFGFEDQDVENEPPKSAECPKNGKTETGSQEKVGIKPSQHSPVLPRPPKAENGLPENEELELELSMARKQKVRRKRRTREYGTGRHDLDSDQSTDDYTPTSVLGAVRRFETKTLDPFSKSPPRVPPRRKPRVAGRLKGMEAKLDRVFSQEHRPDASEENTEEVSTVSPRNSTSSDVSVSQFKELETNNNNNSNVVKKGRTRDKQDMSSTQTKLPSRTTEDGKHSALNGNSDMQLVARQHELIDIEEELLKEPSKLEIEKIFPPESLPKTTSGNQSSEDTLCSDDGKNRDTSPEGNQTATPTPTPKDCGSEARHAGSTSKHKLLSERMWEVWRAGWDGNLADLQYHIGDKPFAMRDEGGDTILHTVVARGHLACVHWLAGGPCSDLVLAENEVGDTPTAVAAKYGQLECLQWLVCETPAGRELRLMGDRQPLLHQAARYGQEPCLRWLLSHMRSQNLGMDIQDHHGNSPAHIAGMHGHLTCLQTLVEYGVDVLAKNRDGLTPCMLAERHGHLTCVNYLIIVESCSTFSEQVIYLKQSLGNKLLPNRTAMDAHLPDDSSHEIRKMLTDYASFTRDLVQQFRQLQAPSSPQDLRVQNRAADLQTRFQQLQQSHQAGRTRTAASNSKMGLEPLDVMRQRLSEAGRRLSNSQPEVNSLRPSTPPFLQSPPRVQRLVGSPTQRTVGNTSDPDSSESNLPLLADPDESSPLHRKYDQPSTGMEPLGRPQQREESKPVEGSQTQRRDVVERVVMRKENKSRDRPESESSTEPNSPRTLTMVARAVKSKFTRKKNHSPYSSPSSSLSSMSSFTDGDTPVRNGGNGLGHSPKRVPPTSEHKPRTSNAAEGSKNSPNAAKDTQPHRSRGKRPGPVIEKLNNTDNLHRIFEKYNIKGIHEDASETSVNSPFGGFRTPLEVSEVPELNIDVHQPPMDYLRRLQPSDSALNSEAAGFVEKEDSPIPRSSPLPGNARSRSSPKSSLKDPNSKPKQHGHRVTFEEKVSQIEVERYTDDVSERSWSNPDDRSVTVLPGEMSEGSIHVTEAQVHYTETEVKLKDMSDMSGEAGDDHGSLQQGDGQRKREQPEGVPAQHLEEGAIPLQNSLDYYNVDGDQDNKPWYESSGDEGEEKPHAHSTRQDPPPSIPHPEPELEPEQVMYF